MRFKVVLVVVGLAIGLLGVAKYLSYSPSTPLADPAPGGTAAGKIIPESPAAVVTVSPALSPPSQRERATNQPVNAEERVAQLLDLAMNNDAESLEMILTELTNPNPEIRKGAREATVQFGDRASAARLEELAARTEDATERAELIASAEFLKLPSLLDRRAPERPAGFTNRIQSPSNAPIRGFRIPRPPTPTASPAGGQ